MAPPGSFANERESLKLNVNFSYINFKHFSIVVALGLRISGLDDNVKDQILALDPKKTAEMLQKSKVCDLASLSWTSIDHAARACFI